MNAFLQQNNIASREFEEGCKIYANQYNVKANEKYLQTLLDSGNYQNRDDRLMLVDERPETVSDKFSPAFIALPLYIW